MLNTIEDLEKEIDEFQNNMSASGEMVQALRQMVEQIKQQNSEFDIQSKSLLARIDNLPSSIENTEITNNERIRNDVAAEFSKAIKQFSELQNEYITALHEMKQSISDYIVEAKNQEDIFIEAKTEMTDKIATSMREIETQNETANNVLKSDVDNIFVARNKEVTDAQDRYLKEMQHTSEMMKSCESKLKSKYSEFLETLEKMNISNLYEQNAQLKSEISKRTTFLMALVVISIVIGVIGLFI